MYFRTMPVVVGYNQSLHHDMITTGTDIYVSFSLSLYYLVFMAT